MKLIQKANRINELGVTTKQSNAMQELQVYKQIYKIPTIQENKVVDKEFFEYCKSKKIFLLLLVYDNDGKVYLKECGVNEFCLPGGEIFDDETIMKAIKRISHNIDKNIVISDVEPLLFVENTFSYQSENVKHIGITMMARSNQKSNDSLYNRFYYLDKNILSKVNVFSNRNILEIYRTRLDDILNQNNGEFQDKEIETNKKYKWRYKFHNNFVKRFILTSRVKRKNKLQSIMIHKCMGCRRLIDVSCGDNSLIFSLINTEQGKSIDYVIANDISWSQIELIPKMDKVIFTNHNAITFPFKDNIFDFVYCSNTLHHMPNYESLQNLLESLLRIGKKVVIYEIEDPAFTGGLPYILNKYWYRGFLKDVGEQYLSYKQFRKIINTAYKNKASIKFETFKNIQGNYMIAEIEKQ